jgi:hypothetical protein
MRNWAQNPQPCPGGSMRLRLSLAAASLPAFLGRAAAKAPQNQSLIGGEIGRVQHSRTRAAMTDNGQIAANTAKH